MRRKFTFIGAGSIEFTASLTRDILTFDAFSDAELVLMDVHEGRLEYARRAVEKLVAAGGYDATVKTTTNRGEALEGADGVLITILQGGGDVWRHDIEIPKSFGVDICVGDTRGPSGIFRFLRTASVMLDIIRDAERLCPNAVILNYTNPMGMLCSYLQKQSDMNITGLCHSVQSTTAMLAEWIGAPMSEVTYKCSGVNHQAFYLDFMWNGEDAYPLLRKTILENPRVLAEEQVRNEMFLQLGYYPTESSGHDSEYNAWFRKRPDLIEKYCTHGTGWNPGKHAYILETYRERESTWESIFREMIESDNADLERGDEYAAYIFNAIFGDHTPFEFNGNLPNTGLIDNLPRGVCVEVPVLASREGIRPFHAGPLPDHLAILVGITARCEDLAVTAAIEGDWMKIYHSILFDPLTSAVLSMAEMRELTRAMFEQNKDFLTYFKSLPT